VRLPSKLDMILWGLAAACALGLLLVVKSWHDRAVYDLPKAQAQVEQLRADYSTLSTAAAANATKTERHGNEFETAERALEAERAATPVRNVRLCVSPDLPATPPARNAPRADHAARPEELPEAPRRDAQAGPDIGPELYDIVDDADHCALTLERAQEWIRDNQ